MRRMVTPWLTRPSHSQPLFHRRGAAWSHPKTSSITAQPQVGLGSTQAAPFEEAAPETTTVVVAATAVAAAAAAEPPATPAPVDEPAVGAPVADVCRHSASSKSVRWQTDTGVADTVIRDGASSPSSSSEQQPSFFSAVVPSFMQSCFQSANAPQSGQQTSA